MNLDERSWFILPHLRPVFKRAGDGNIVRRIVLRYSKIKNIVIVIEYHLYFRSASRGCLQILLGRLEPTTANCS